jgi:hypothetical protein
VVTAEPLPATAYIDESLRVHAGLYFLAAVSIPDHNRAPYRDVLATLPARGQTRLHWRNESAARRARITVTISGLHLRGAIVVAAGMTADRQERARRKCIERLLPQLSARGITRVIFERRQADLDARDRIMITALRRQHAIPAALRATWLAADTEPLLWLPDIIAGAASLAAIGDDTYWKHLDGGFTIERLTLN